MILRTKELRIISVSVDIRTRHFPIKFRNFNLRQLSSYINTYYLSSIKRQIVAIHRHCPISVLPLHKTFKLPTHNVLSISYSYAVKLSCLTTLHTSDILFDTNESIPQFCTLFTPFLITLLPTRTHLSSCIFL